jgi:hypothetical protein
MSFYAAMCTHTAAADGRYVVAAADIPAGALVLRSEPFSLSIHPLHTATRCCHCLSLVDAKASAKNQNNAATGGAATGSKKKKPPHKMKNANYLAMKQMLSSKKRWEEEQRSVEQSQQQSLADDGGSDQEEQECDRPQVSSSGARYSVVEDGRETVQCKWCSATYCSMRCVEETAGRHAGLECRMLQALARISAHRQVDELHYLRCLADIVVRAVQEGFGRALSSENETEATKTARNADESTLAGGVPCRASDEERSADVASDTDVSAPPVSTSSTPPAGSAARPFAVSADIPAEALRLRQRRQLSTQVEIVEKTSAATPPSIEALLIQVSPAPLPSEQRPTAPRPNARQWPLFAALVTNLSDMPKDQVSKFAKLYRLFVKLVGEMYAASSTPQSHPHSVGISPPTSSVEGTDAEELFLRCVSEHTFMAMCAALQCNGFGVYDPAESCLAIGTYPLASFFNHSCNPNICRVMRGRVVEFYSLRNVPSGDALTISYIDAEKTTSERRHVLLSSYRFYCECGRCARGDVLQASRCAKCSARGYLVPFARLPFGEGECSVCHSVAKLGQPT